jgi:protein translocase SecG subunit
MLIEILQIIVSIILIGAILLQAQGGGLSPAFGGGGETYRSRQSIEKILLIVTVICAALLAVLSLVLLAT